MIRNPEHQNAENRRLPSEVVAPRFARVAEVLLSINAIHLALVAADRPLYDGSYFVRWRFLDLWASERHT